MKEQNTRQTVNIKVFNGGDQHMGFGVNSTIIFGATEAAVVRYANCTLANAHRLVADILETGCDLKYIYITHWHPDHFLGLSVVHEAFPNARVVSLPSIAAKVNEAYDFKITYWGTEVFREQRLQNCGPDSCLAGTIDDG
ncbi:MBL fold metallo-hydrolase [Vibrio sp. PP-XX7]